MPTITTAQVYAGLRYADGSKWSGATLTYSIPAAGAQWDTSGQLGYAPASEPFDPAYGVLNASQQNAFISALGAWDKLINLNFVQVPESGLNVGQIRIAFTDAFRQIGDNGAAAYANTPPPPGGSIVAKNGDIWLDDALKDDDVSVGSHFYSTLIHEIGHALGLKHPFEGVQLPTEFNNTRYTVMAYDAPDDGLVRVFTRNGNSLQVLSTQIEPSTPMPLDIIAIQGIYGASTSAALGNDTYTFDESKPLLATLVDNGGRDLIDLSTHTRPSIVDLTPGAFSSIDFYSVQAQIAAVSAANPGFGSFIAGQLNQPGTYTWSNNLATSLDTVIEDVRGGSGDDSVLGNSADNNLSGGAGNDTLDGAGASPLGNYIRGDDGNDSLIGGSGFDDINGNMGNDTVQTGAGEDYCVGGKDNDSLSGGADYDLVYGNLGNDTCDGGDGNDIVRGGQDNDSVMGGNGDDFVSGDKGSDTMVGGAGADIFHTFGDAGIDRVIDFSRAQGDRVQLDPGTQFTVSQVGADTVIDMVGGGQMTLVGVQMSTLTPGWIFGA